MTVTLELRRQGVSAQLLPSIPLTRARVRGCLRTAFGSACRRASLLSCRSHT